MSHSPLSKPPEGVTAGRDVPRENEASEVERQQIDAMVAALKTKPGYRQKDDSELREEAKERLR